MCVLTLSVEGLFLCVHVMAATVLDQHLYTYLIVRLGPLVKVFSTKI